MSRDNDKLHKSNDLTDERNSSNCRSCRESRIWCRSSGRVSFVHDAEMLRRFGEGSIVRSFPTKIRGLEKNFTASQLRSIINCGWNTQQTCSYSPTFISASLQLNNAVFDGLCLAFNVARVGHKSQERLRLTFRD